MTVRELSTRVTATAVLAAVPLALVGGWLGGGAGAVGVLAGAGLAVWSFRRLVAHAVPRAATGPGWILTAALRFLIVAAAVGTLVALGWTHPVGILVGYSVLPVIVVVHGLRLAKESPSWK